MNVTLGVLADYASVAQDAKLSIMGIFNEVNPPALPFALPMMYLVIVFEAGPAEFDTDKTIKVTLLDADGHQILGIEQPIKVPQSKRPGNRVSLNAILALAGVKFERPGEYAFSILVGGEEKKSISLRVNEPIIKV